MTMDSAAPITVQAAGHTVIGAIERRSPCVSSPRWVGPVVAFRDLSTRIMDEYLAHNRKIAQAVRDAANSQGRKPNDVLERPPGQQGHEGRAGHERQAGQASAPV
jgi:hypothetical protein